MCPAWRHQYEIEALPVEERAGESGAVLVDEYLRVSDELSALKARQEELRDAIAVRAGADGADRLFGTEGSVKVFRYLSVGLPDTKDPRRAELEAELRSMGLWERFASLGAFQLSRAIGDGAIGAEELARLEPYITRADGVKLYPKRG